MIKQKVTFNVVETKCTDYKPLLPRIGGVRTEKVKPLNVRKNEKTPITSTRREPTNPNTISH